MHLIGKRHLYLLANTRQIFTEWKPLSNFDIIKCCNGLKIGNFYGVFMRDELGNNKFSDYKCLVLNLNVISVEGIYWMSLLSKNNISCYFD